MAREDVGGRGLMDTASFTLHLAEKMADPENGSPFTKPLRLRDFCGDSWTRTNDPIDVNDVLYRLSHATTLLVYTSYHFGLPTKTIYPTVYHR